MDKWALDVQLIKSNRAYFYETVTAMFIHFSYKHLAGNLIFAFFIMYEI
jgi:membrane associated rhomboid family serine protease